MTGGPLYLSRARLRRDAPAAALLPVLVPSGESERAATAHRLVWTLFADAADRTRDFLFREAEPGLFYLLSARPPEDRHGLFHVDPPKPFAPSLAAGDRLAFSLRANATVARGSGGRGGRGKPCDVVMDALHGVPAGARASARQRAVRTAGLAWLAAQGTRHGFDIDVPADAADPDGEAGDDTLREAVRVVGYRTLRLGRAGAPARLGVLDFEGVLTVRDPDAFVTALGRGFGRAKAFGCGLMLIRRA